MITFYATAKFPSSDCSYDVQIWPYGAEVLETKGKNTVPEKDRDASPAPSHNGGIEQGEKHPQSLSQRTADSHDLVRLKPSSLFMLLEWSSTSITSMMSRSMQLSLVGRFQ